MGWQQIKTKKMLWVNIIKPKRREMEALKKKYNFHQLDLEDCLVKVQRPQFSEYHHYLFCILTFPIYNRQSREIESSEIDFFVGNNYLISINDGLNPIVSKFFQEVTTDHISQETYLDQHPVFLMYEILHRLQNSTLPMLDHVSKDIEDIERRIFKGEERKVVRDILHIKRNIVYLRKILQAHKNVIKKLMGTSSKFFMPDKMNIYFSNILDRTKDIWDILETQKENINAFHETNESLISNKLNDIMKILTIISVIIIPANLVAAIFGMSSMNLPVISEPFGWLKIIIFIFFTMLLFTLFFIKKKWL